MNRISVVVIGKNEQDHIERCLRSVIMGCESLPDTEIIYVDSASKDKTVEIAKQFPVRIIQLKPSWRLTSSAGRYLGFKNTSGKYVFFVDGDTVVYKHWLEEAVAFIQKDPTLGGVAGIVHEMAVDETGQRINFKKNRYNLKKGITPVNVFGGIALYPRAVLEQVQPFNPFIKATPELELALRIRKAGYRLVRLDKPMAITYAPQRETFREILRRSRSNLYSMGDTLHYCKKNGVAGTYIKERMGFIIRFLIVNLISWAILLFSLLSRNWIIFGGWIFLSVAFLILLTIRKRSFRKVFISFFKRSVILLKTIQSLFTARVRDADEYPTDVIEIQ